MKKVLLNVFESSTVCWAVLQSPCCPSKRGELSENILQNLVHNLKSQTVRTLQCTLLPLRDDPKYICAIGFEPNPNHAAPLKEIEEAFSNCGWRAHFFTETAVSNYTGTTQFYTDNAMGYKVGVSKWPSVAQCCILDLIYGTNFFLQSIYTVGRPLIPDVL